MAIWRRKGVSTADIEEARVALEADPPRPRPGVLAPKGFEDGIPLGGTTKQNPGGTQSIDRQTAMSEFYGAYLSCPPASACIDIIARTITAGGLEIVPDDETPDSEANQELPPQVKRLQDLFDYVNPRQNIRELMRAALIDLLIFGDAFLEVVWVAGLPAALFSLDCPSMIPLADEHGTLKQPAYTQQLDPQRSVDFEAHEVIHIKLDAPRGGVYGVGAIQKTLVPIMAYLFTAGLLKEIMRKGDPPKVHLDYPLEVPEPDIERDRQKWQVKSLGVANVGNPFITRGGVKAGDLSPNKIAELLATLDQLRDAILMSMGVPPRKLSIAEPGQLGGTGEGAVSDKTFRVNTCGPLEELVLEAVNFDLTLTAFGITGWSVKFGEVDWRDDETIEKIRDQRLRNGSWPLNRYLNEIGEEPIGPAGDRHVIMERQLVLDWEDVGSYSEALVVGTSKGEVLPQIDDGELEEPEPAPVPPSTVPAGTVPPGPQPPKGQRGPQQEEAAAIEAWDRDYQQRRRRALKELEKVN